MITVIDQGNMEKWPKKTQKIDQVKDKANILKHRTEGRITEEEGVYCDKGQLGMVLTFRYLGITVDNTECNLSS
jgi:hypothetical protein